MNPPLVWKLQDSYFFYSIPYGTLFLKDDILKKMKSGGVDTEFSNKTVVITGASVGIEKATALEFAKNGANVCIIDVQAEGLHRVSAEIKGLRANVSSFICDVSDEQKVREVIGKIIKQYGNIDVLVNNAGLWRMWKPQVMNGNREFM